MKLTIATRESRLALWQAQFVQSVLQSQGHTVEVLGMTTRGDQILDVSLSKIGGKGLFVKELETALLDGRADLAVHSLKDVPMDLPSGLRLSCVSAREDARDAFVSENYASLGDLPEGAVVGTSSLRRMTQLWAMRPDLRIEPLRGNLDTRMGKLVEGQYDAIVLAAAGLKRLGCVDKIRSYFSLDEILPAPGQGALAMEIASHRGDVAAALSPLMHTGDYYCAMAERAVSRALGASCQVPLAAHAVLVDGEIHLSALWGDVHKKSHLLRAQGSVRIGSGIESSLDHLAIAAADELGRKVAAQLMKQGAIA